MVITVYGLGAIGSNLLVQLAKQYPDAEFHGVDFDEVEDRNIRTQAYFLEHVGMRKAQAMRVILYRYLRKPKYTHEIMKVTSAYRRSQKSDLILDCFDNTDSRALIKRMEGNVLHIGFSPQYSAECIWNERYDVPNDVDPAHADICSMTEAVPFIHYIVNLAALNIAHFFATQQKRDFIVTQKERVRWL